MKYSVKNPFKWLCCVLFAAASLTSCDMMTEDLSDCPYGLYLNFKYDYNLERADMFNDHVGSVTLYIFDESGRLVTTKEESNSNGAFPLKDKNYSMHITDLAPGKYKFIALAGQKPYGDMLETNRARFIRSDMSAGCDMTDLKIQLDRTEMTEGLYAIINNGLPLDTLWHGMETGGFELSATRPTYDTISLVRDTKKINVTLREMEDPWIMDINNYELKIIDRNSTLLWDNSVDETTGTVVYTPHATWNTEDSTPAVDGNGDILDGVGRIAHADFMTSRLIYHENPADGYPNLVITSRETGLKVADINLADVLSRLRTSEDTYRYSPQEFLDRGYDYSLSIFLQRGKIAYINISISVLGWNKRIQYEEL